MFATTGKGLTLSTLAVSDSNQPALFDDQGNFTSGTILQAPDVMQKEWLIGIPLKIVTATFHVPAKGNGMVSLEAYIGSEQAIRKNLRRNSIAPEAMVDGQLIVEPGEYIVVNDGGTGVRRQILEMMETEGRVDLGHPKMPKTGKLGESRYDLPWCQKKGDTLVPVWKSFATSVLEGEISVPYFAVELILPKGFRPSQYENEQGENTTYYLQ